MVDHSTDTFDYVVVGSGAAGAVLASRLTEDPNVTVCVLEAGPPDRNPYIHIPAGFIKLGGDPKCTFQFQTEPHPATHSRAIKIAHGRTLGGSTSINGFNCVRGQHDDFDDWAARGCNGWSYEDVLPYFKRCEQRLGDGDPTYRGFDGPLPVTDCDWRHPLCDAFIEAAHQAGVRHNPDYNGAFQEGAGYYQRSIRNGYRVSTAKAFLKPARGRSNLEVRTNAPADSLLVENGQAVGVSYGGGRNDRQGSVRVRREVILCAGAANTPKLLMRSGLGPAAHLSEHGIDVLRDLPGVGANLKDHFMIRVTARVKNVKTLNEQARGLSLLGQIARWAVGKPSLLTISPSVAFAFWMSRAGLTRPDIQMHFSPGSYKENKAGLLDDYPGMTLGSYQLRPKSAGTVRLASPYMDDDPTIQPAYLTDPEDERVAIDGIRMCRKLLRSSSFAPYFDDDDQPSSDLETDDELLDFARRRGGTAWHLMGTCRMGPLTDEQTVVDPELKFRGIDRLRIADASIMPDMTSGNLQIPTMMIGEKAADLILGRGTTSKMVN